MTADEFRKILDRFETALGGIEDWAENHLHKGEEHPKANRDLHGVWVDLNRQCRLMRAVRTSEIERIQKVVDAL